LSVTIASTPVNDSITVVNDPSIPRSLKSRYRRRMRPSSAVLSAIALALSLSSCQPPDRDIVVRWSNGELVVDFPWSLRRLVGLQDRTYCIRRVQLYDVKGMVWMLDLTGNRSCEDVAMPIRLGKPLRKFISAGQLHVERNVTYGIAVEGIGRGRIAFELHGNKVRNIRERNAMPAPCDEWGPCDMTRGSFPAS
jgi:hypothetical protein